MEKLHSLILLGLLTIASISFGQSKLQSHGERFLKKKQFQEALNYFSEMDSSKVASDPFYDYYMGVIYYSLTHDQENGIPYFEHYLQRVDSMHIEYYGHHHVYFMLGKLYHLDYNFDKAEEYYGYFIEKI